MWIYINCNIIFETKLRMHRFVSSLIHWLSILIQSWYAIGLIFWQYTIFIIWPYTQIWSIFLQRKNKITQKKHKGGKSWKLNVKNKYSILMLFTHNLPASSIMNTKEIFTFVNHFYPRQIFLEKFNEINRIRL